MPFKCCRNIPVPTLEGTEGQYLFQHCVNMLVGRRRIGIWQSNLGKAKKKLNSCFFQCMIYQEQERICKFLEGIGSCKTELQETV